MKSGKMRIVIEVRMEQDTPTCRAQVRAALHRAAQGVLINQPANCGVRYDIQREVVVDGKTGDYKWTNA